MILWDSTGVYGIQLDCIGFCWIFGVLRNLQDFGGFCDILLYFAGFFGVTRIFVKFCEFFAGFYGTRRDFMRFGGSLWDFMEFKESHMGFRGSLCNSTGVYGIQWDFMGFSWIAWIFLVFDVLQNHARYCEILWDTTGFYAICRIIMGVHRI